jgi:hypothetical protein
MSLALLAALCAVTALASTVAGMVRAKGSAGAGVYGLAAAFFWMAAIVLAVAASGK